MKVQLVISDEIRGIQLIAENDSDKLILTAIMNGGSTQGATAKVTNYTPDGPSSRKVTSVQIALEGA